MNGKHIAEFHIAIIGGGASGLFTATSLATAGKKIALFERGERLGKKLSATGNGQGNITNRAVKTTPYFSLEKKATEKVSQIVSKYDEKSLCDFFQELGVLIFFDERGRGYPTGRQASALTDALRFNAQERGVQVWTDSRIVDLQKQGDIFLLTTQDGKKFSAEKVVLCTGGKCAKNFGTDGESYALATRFGHTLTPLYPSLVQLKTETKDIRTLKGIRVFDAGVKAIWTENGSYKSHALRGDIIFTEYGVSGDAVFRLSAFIADKKDARLIVDFLPDFSEKDILEALQRKRKALPSEQINEWLCGIVNNQVGRAVMKKVASADLATIASAVKNFCLSVQGTLGFDYAQVTKGGIPLIEVDNSLQSKKVKGLYFAGEILDVDGECGGFNLQWAYASAQTVASALEKEETRG